MSQPEIILRYVEKSDWVVGYNLEKVNTPFGWISHQGLRTCRSLAERGLLETKHDKYVHYRITEKGKEYLNQKDSPIVQEMRKKMIENEEAMLF